MITKNIKSNLISTSKNTIKLSKYLRIKKIEGGGFLGKKIDISVCCAKIQRICKDYAETKQ